MKRRVVITGTGAVTPLGVGARSLYERWAAGECGIVDGAGACSEFEPKDVLSVKEVRRLDRFSQLALVAAAEAVAQAGWDGELPYDPMRVGCVIATGIGGIETVETQHDVMRDKGAKMVSPLGIPQYMPNAAAAAVSIKHGLQGQMYGIVSACSSGGHAIGSGLRMIQYGDADAVLAGGAEASLTTFGFACFNSMQALSPTGISRPFDARRDGFVMGEGAGVLVLEEAEAAAARGATILGEIVGYGSTSDAHHLTAPDPSGVPAARAIELALKDAGVEPGGLDYVNAHGTSTQLNDAAETAALKRGARRGAGQAGADLLDEVRDRPSARRCRRGRGRCDDRDAPRPADTADARLRGPRSRARSRLRARSSPRAGDRQRAAARRGVELVRVRWPQRGARVQGAVRVSATLERVLDGRSSPLERLEALCDPGSIQVLRSRVVSTRLGARATAGDGVIGATGTVDGRPIACYAQDGSFLGGSLGERHAGTIVRVLETAGRARIPVVGFVESGGARMQEGTAALGGYGQIFRETVRLTGVVPQISIVSGASAGGGAYSPALTDLIVMTEDAAMFLTGPGVVREALGEEIDAAGLGGPKVHERNGVCHLVEHDQASAAEKVRAILGYLPSSAGDPLPRLLARDPLIDDPGAVVPTEQRRAYDVRDALAGIVDANSMLELCPRWARNVVTTFARIDGRPVGIVANQPRYLGGVLDAEGSEKAARFVNFCDSFGLPLLAIVDTPGFMPGSRQEQAGVIRHGASLVRAFAAARVPKLTVILRKSYGGAYITMNSRDLGADLVLAWPSAEMGIMAARAAVGIVNRRELRAADDPEAERDRLAQAYAEEHLGAEAAAAAGFVDEIVDPGDTRERLMWALLTLTGARA